MVANLNNDEYIVVKTSSCVKGLILAAIAIVEY